LQQAPDTFYQHWLPHSVTAARAGRQARGARLHVVVRMSRPGFAPLGAGLDPGQSAASAVAEVAARN
jgi:hypothetical protein